MVCRETGELFWELSEVGGSCPGRRTVCGSSRQTSYNGTKYIQSHPEFLGKGLFVWPWLSHDGDRYLPVVDSGKHRDFVTGANRAFPDANDNSGGRGLSVHRIHLGELPRDRGRLLLQYLVYVEKLLELRHLLNNLDLRSDGFQFPDDRVAGPRRHLYNPVCYIGCHLDIWRVLLVGSHLYTLLRRVSYLVGTPWLE